MKSTKEIIEELIKEFQIDGNIVKITKIGNKYKVVSDTELAIQDFLAITSYLAQRSKNE